MIALGERKDRKGVKFLVCQKCGEPLTDEHVWARNCKKCNPAAARVAVRPYGKIPFDGEREMDPSKEYEIRRLDFSVGVKCLSCSREIDIISNRTQDFEMVCPTCGNHYRPEFKIIEIDARARDVRNAKDKADKEKGI